MFNVYYIILSTWIIDHMENYFMQLDLDLNIIKMLTLELK